MRDGIRMRSLKRIMKQLKIQLKEAVRTGKRSAVLFLLAAAMVFPGFCFRAEAAETPGQKNGGGYEAGGGYGTGGEYEAGGGYGTGDGYEASGGYEAETGNLLDDFDLAKIENFMSEESGNGTFSFTFKELILELMKGNFSGVFHECLLSLRDSLFGEIAKNGKWMGQVLILGLTGAIFANFSSIFSNSQIAETGFYVTYLLMFTFLASSFLTGIAITKEILSHIIEFMRALVPTYFLAVSFSGGSLTSAAGYGWMLFSISAVEWLVLRLLLPVLRIYILFVLAGHMVKEDIFSRMTELLDSSIRWGLKTMTGVILGFHLLQNLVTPYADSLKNTSLQRFVSVIPGLGQGAAAVSQMVMGAGVLIKNSIGAGAVIILILISVIPLLKLVILCLFYQGAAALLQPVCDKRMVACISEVGNGCRLLLSMAATALLLFSVSLAIVCTAANATYFAG